MSAAVESTHRSHFSPMLDTMARPGSGWSHDAYTPRHSGYYPSPSPQEQYQQQHQQEQQQLQQPQQHYQNQYQSPPHPPPPPPTAAAAAPHVQQQQQNGRLPGPSSLFSSPPPSTSSAAVGTQHHPLSPPGRELHYNGGGGPGVGIGNGLGIGINSSSAGGRVASAYYGGDYATPSPVSQTPPMLPLPTGGEQQPHHGLAPRRHHPDVRLSPTQSSTTSDRSDDVLDGQFRGGGSGFPNHSVHSHAHQQHQQQYQQQHHHQQQAQQPFSSRSGQPPSLPPPSTKQLPPHMQQPVRTLQHHEDPRQSAAGGLMGKLIPQSYSANGRHHAQPIPGHLSNPLPRPALPPSVASSTTPAATASTAATAGIHSPLSSHPPPQQFLQRSPPPQQYPTSPPMSNHHNRQPQHPSSAYQRQQQQPQQSSMSPRPEAKQMSINSLLSATAEGVTAASTVSTMSSPKAPVEPMSAASSSSGKQPMMMLSPAQSTATLGGASSSSLFPSLSALPASEYRIVVRQQPVAARSCGFGERDRRVIDPPPIVQLLIDEGAGENGGGGGGGGLGPEEVSRRIRHPFSVVHCSIWNETGEQDNSAMPEDYRQQRRLMGTLVASPFVGLDENKREGCFFCFPDLSCRTPGSFRLKFSLVVINPLQMKVGVKSPIVATVMSEVFTVYNAKDFPGMQASTPLTKRLKEQGCLISIKKGNEKAGGGGGGGGSKGRAIDDSDDDDDDEGAGSGGRKKRARKG